MRGDCRSNRRGAVVVVVAVALAMVLAFAAFSIDAGVLYVARTELQASADAAALAAASAYFSDAGLIRNLSGLMPSVRERARQFAAANEVLGEAPGLADSDVVLGKYTWGNPLAELDTSDSSTFNAVQVTVRRTASSANGAVGYFLDIFGRHSGNVIAEAVGVVNDRFGGYDPRPDPRMIPITLSRWLWDNQVETSGGDAYSYNESSGMVLAAADGIREVKIFPWKESGSGGVTVGPDGSGNYGYLEFGSGALGTQIENNLTPAEIETTIGSPEFDFYDDSGDSRGYPISGTTGSRTGLESSFQARIGDIIGVFVHDSVTSSGTGSNFNVVDIRFGRVMAVDLRGAPSTRYVLIQPVAFTGEGIKVDENAPSSGGQVGVVALGR